MCRANTMDKCSKCVTGRADEERAGPLPGRAAGAKNADACAHRAMKRIHCRIVYLEQKKEKGRMVAAQKKGRRYIDVLPSGTC